MMVMTMHGGDFTYEVGDCLKVVRDDYGVTEGCN